MGHLYHGYVSHNQRVHTSPYLKHQIIWLWISGRPKSNHLRHFEAGVTTGVGFLVAIFKIFPIFQPLILYLDYLVSNELGQYLQSFIVILTPNLCFPHFVQIKVSASKIPVSITPQSARHAQPTWSGRRAADPGVYGPWQLRGKDRNPPAKERNLVESGIKNHQKLPCPVKANLAMNNHRNIIIFDRTIFTSRAVLQWKSGLWTKYLVKLDFLSLNSPSPLSVKSFTTHLKLVPLRQPHGPISTQLPLGPRGRHLPGLRCARAPGTVVSKIDCFFLACILAVLLALLLPSLPCSAPSCPPWSPPSSPSGHPHNIALQAFLSQHLRKLKLLGLDHEIWLLLSKHSFKMGLPRKTAPGP